MTLRPYDRGTEYNEEAKHEQRKQKAAAAAAKKTAKHKKLQAKVNKHLGVAAREHGYATAKQMPSAMRETSRKAAARHTNAAAKAKAQLPQGYAMVFGKLRKITAGKPRTGIAKLKR
jgi:hypothetical protein